MRIFLALILFSLAARAEFGMLSKRYITAYDFENRLVGLFGEVYKKYPAIYDCNEGLKKFGFSQPATGQPLSAEPNADTIKTINDCYRLSFKASETYLFTVDRKTYIQFFAQFIPEAVLESKVPAAGYTGWHNGYLTKEEQGLMVAQMVESFLGTDEVILSYGVIKDVSAFRAYLQSQLSQSDSIIQMLNKLSVQLSLRDEYLTY